MTREEFAKLLVQYVKYITMCIVDHEDQVHVNYVMGEATIVIKIDCAISDRGQLLGSKGGNIRAIRELVGSLAGRYKIRAVILLGMDDL